MKRTAWSASAGILIVGVLTLANPWTSLSTPPAGAELTAAWEELAADDARQAYRAIWLLAQIPARAVKLLQEKLAPAPPPDLEQIQRWLTDLDSPTFAVRDRAFRELEKQGELAEPALSKALDDKTELEKRRRIEALLERLQGTNLSPDKVRLIRAIEVLELIGTDEAKGLLQRLAKGYSQDRLTREAQETLQRLQQRREASGGSTVAPVKLPPTATESDPLPFGARVRLGTTLFRQPGYVRRFPSFSADSKIIATAGKMGVHLWETETGKLHRKLDYDASCLAFAPHGMMLALGTDATKGANGAIVFWDSREGKEVGKVVLPAGESPKQLSFAPDSRLLHALLSNDSLRTWDCRSRQEIKHWKPVGKYATLLGFSPAANRAVVRHPPVGNLFLIDLQNDVSLPLPGLQYDPDRVSFSPDGKHLLMSGAGRNSVQIWDVQTGQRRWIQGNYSTHYRGPLGVSPDGSVVAASGYAPKGIHLWDMPSGKYLRELSASEGFEVGAFSPDSRWLAGVATSAIRIWDWKTGKVVLDDGDGHVSVIQQMAFFPRLDAIGTHDIEGDGAFLLWDRATGKLRQRVKTNNFYGHCSMALSADGKWLAATDTIDGLVLWEVDSGRKVFRLPGYRTEGEFQLLRFAPNSKSLLSWAAPGYYLHKWDVTSGKCLLENQTRPRGLGFPKPTDEDNLQRGLSQLDLDRVNFLTDCAFSPQADRFIMASRQGDLHVFEVATGKESRVIELGLSHPLLAVSPSGKLFAMTYEQPQMTIGDLNSGRILRTIAVPGRQGFTVFSPDERTVAVATDATIVLIEIATGKTRLTMKRVPIAYFPMVFRPLAYSPDGTQIVTAMDDATALVWDLALLAGKEALKEE